VTRYRRLLTLFALLTIGAQQPPERRWFKLETAEQQKIGFGWTESVNSANGRTITLHQEMVTKEREGRAQRIADTTTRSFSADGQLVRIERLSFVGKEKSVTRVSFTDSEALIERITKSGTVRSKVALSPDTQRDGGDALIRKWDFAAQPKLTFNAFSLSAKAVERVEVIRSAEPNPQLPEGHVTLHRYSYDGPHLRAVTRLVRDAKGNHQSASQPLYGTRVMTTPTTAEDAQAPFPPFSPLTVGRVKSLYKIDAEAIAGHIRYTFRFNSGTPFPLPQTGEQRFRIDGDRMIVDICQSCGLPQSLSEEERAAALRPTTWLQSDHPRIQAIARRYLKSDVSDEKKMEQLGVEARKYLTKIDFAGHFSAADALARGRGDCSEDAVVLAALGRAAGIPTKVVSGMVYSRARYHGIANSFLAHSWVVAWIDGRWQSFDISLGKFDATHIAFSIGDGDTRAISSSDQLAGLISWEAMTEVKKRPAAD
jgi:hypothetical protein